MIRWHQTHSGVFASVALAVSILLFYTVLVIPIVVPEFIAGVSYFIPAALLVAVVDHGHLQTPWSKRIWRLLASWVLTVAWMLVAGSLVNMVSGVPFTFNLTWRDTWPLLVVGAVLAGLGMMVIRWMERQSDPFHVSPSRPTTPRARVRRIGSARV